MEIEQTVSGEYQPISIMRVYTDEEIMKVNEFLANFWPEDFVGGDGTSPWLNCDEFDPKYTREELRAMQKADVIKLNERDRTFRLSVSIENAISLGFTYND